MSYSPMVYSASILTPRAEALSFLTAALAGAAELAKRMDSAIGAQGSGSKYSTRRGAV